MEYIHEIDDEMYNSLHDMLVSESELDVNLAVDILNKANINNRETFNRVLKLIEDYSVDIVFDFREDNNLQSFTFFTRAQYWEKVKQREPKFI